MHKKHDLRLQCKWTGHLATCNSDTGGPMIVHGATSTQHASARVISWRSPSAVRIPDVYTHVSYVTDWIVKEGCELTSYKSKLSNCGNPYSVKTRQEDKGVEGLKAGQ